MRAVNWDLFISSQCTSDGPYAWQPSLHQRETLYTAPKQRTTSNCTQQRNKEKPKKTTSKTHKKTWKFFKQNNRNITSTPKKQETTYTTPVHRSQTKPNRCQAHVSSQRLPLDVLVPQNPKRRTKKQWVLPFYLYRKLVSITVLPGF